MFFSNTSYLLGFLGLIIPILIHLWSKKESKILRVGSIKFLPKSETSRSRSIQLNEKLLLLLRSLLVGLITLLLANLLIEKKENFVSKIFLVEPSLISDVRVKRALDTLESEQVRLWQSNFPIVEEGAFIDSVSTNHYQLLSQAKSLAADSLVIFTTASIQQIKGKRPSSAKYIQWISIDPLEAKIYHHRKLKTPQENLIIEAVSTGTSTSYRWKKADLTTLSSESWDTLHFSIVYNPEFERDKIYINAALRSIEKLGKRTLSIQEYSIDTYDSGLNDTDWLIWLSDKKMLPNDEASVTLKYEANDFKPLISGSDQQYYLHQRLNRKNVVSSDLAGSLLRILLPPKADKQEVRQANVGQLSPVITDQVSENSTPKRSMSIVLWCVLISLLLLERYYSMKRAL